jgi:hypothetical protein
VVRIEDVTAPGVIRLLTNLSSRRLEYRDHLTAVIPAYLAEAQRTATMFQIHGERWVEQGRRSIKAIAGDRIVEEAPR